MSAEGGNPFEFIDQIVAFVANVTGMKSQLVDAGWSPENAEALVVEAFRANRGAS